MGVNNILVDFDKKFRVPVYCHCKECFVTGKKDCKQCTKGELEKHDSIGEDDEIKNAQQRL